MASRNLKWCLAAAAFTAAALAGCHDDHSGGSPSAPPASPNMDFVAFTKQVYANGENTTPVNLDGLTFDFSDQDPTAFDGLLM